MHVVYRLLLYIQNNRNKINIALCGLGNYASMLADGIEASEYCNLSGIVTGTPSKAEPPPARHPANAGTDPPDRGGDL